MLSGTEMLDGEGKKVIGTMPDNGAISSTMDGLETKSVSIPAGYTSGGTVALDSTIDNTANSQATQIDEIMELLEGKSAGDGGSGGGSLETGTLTTVTSFVVSYTHYYADLENIPDIASKHLVVLHYTDSSKYNPSWVLTRNSLDDEFSVSAATGDQSFNDGYSLTGYVFVIRQSSTIVGELTYYAV